MDRSRRAVGRTYDDIADHFAETRAYPWPEVTDFLDQAPTGGVGLDLGCANGRHLPPLAERADAVLGVDLSRALLEIAVERDIADGCCQADAALLPLADNSVRTAVYVATLHHLPTQEERRASLDELARVLEPEGQALVSAWSTAHDRFERETGFDTIVEWTLPDGGTRDRFYHIYDPEEFKTDLTASDLCVQTVELSNGNCYGTVTGPEE